MEQEKQVDEIHSLLSLGPGTKKDYRIWKVIHPIKNNEVDTFKRLSVTLHTTKKLDLIELTKTCEEISKQNNLKKVFGIDKKEKFVDYLYLTNGETELKADPKPKSLLTRFINYFKF